MTAADLGFAHVFEPAQRPGLPTLLLLHGTGGDEHDLIPLGQTLLPGAALLSPRGKVLEGGMPRFFRRLTVGVFDLEDLHRRTTELAEFVAASAEQYDFDPANVVGAGYSNGANIAASLLLSHPGVLRAAALLHAQVPFVPREQPNLAGTTVFISGGRADAMVPAAETERLSVLLRDAGADLTLHWEAGGHALTPGEVGAAQRWFAALP